MHDRGWLGKLKKKRRKEELASGQSPFKTNNGRTFMQQAISLQTWNSRTCEGAVVEEDGAGMQQKERGSFMGFLEARVGEGGM